MSQRKLDFLIKLLPQIYNLAPSQIVVIEDSASTSKNVQDAGMAVAYVKHKLNEKFIPNTGIVFECY